ncbi:hypothetical protein [Flavobacterium sp. K5-23]|uniref:hypothetical protein n=1 Tax=Flavobacterium sp. K5-23 TaxID=2746225 RepID=UPI00200CA1B2|nr:hypothetical protein [Flavobacterium sp. K5-23]UQD56926.1 hypothetical protein FLAK523_11235 [Flavobacterium sp. K5-23]
MKQALTILLFILSISIEMNAQKNKEIYKFSEDINNKIEKDTVPWRYQVGATEFSINGNYKKALQTWDRQGAKKKSVSIKDSLYFNEFQPKDAKDYIINRSKKERVIIINEAHNNSRHRVFTTSLLKGLYKNGCRYFGIEALYDSLVNTRKFATLESGSMYLHESQYSNLIKEALDIGFVLFEYEYKVGKTGKEREIEQAENIAKMMAKHPNDKFLIHCGYDHLNEGIPGISSWEKAMAARLNDMTGVNPFTIDQVPSSESGSPEFNNPYIRIANTVKPVIMINGKGETFNGSVNYGIADCRIIHPVTIYKNGRPDWLTLDGRRKAYRIATDSISEFPVLALAYRINEFEKEGVPADVIEINNKDQEANLILDNGIYRIIIKNRGYKTILDYQKKI